MNKKSFTSGLIIGAIVMSTFNVLATNVIKVVDTLLVDHFSILIDGKKLELPYDTHIMNFKGSVYTPARAVAEALGAEVTWVESQNAVFIKTPEPTIVELECDRLHVSDSTAHLYDFDNTNDDDGFTQIIHQYNKTPVRAEMANTLVEVLSINRMSDITGIRIGIENNKNEYIDLKFQDAKIIHNGYTYMACYSQNLYSWSTVIDSLTKKEPDYLYFEGLPRNADKLTIILPFEYDRYDDNLSLFESDIMIYEINVDFDGF